MERVNKTDTLVSTRSGHYAYLIKTSDQLGSAEENLSQLSNRKLFELTHRGPYGTGEVSHAALFRKEVKASVVGAYKKLEHEIQCRWFPNRASNHPLHEHFGSHVRPEPDNRTNHRDPMDFSRHDIFEREGRFIRDLRNLGAETIGEFQTEISWWKDRIRWHTKGVGKITVESDDLIVRAYEMTLKGTQEEKLEKAKEALTKFSEEVAYYKMAICFTENQPALIDRLLNFPDFPELKRQFIDAHIAASRSSDESIAAAMIAGHYLLLFEGTKAAQSPSQKFITDSENYHSKLGNFLTDYGQELTPPRPTNTRSSSLSELETKTLQLLEKRYLGENPNLERYQEAYHRLYGVADDGQSQNPDGPFTASQKEQYLRQVSEQMWRLKIDQEIIRRIARKHPNLLYTDPEGRRNLIQTVIGNVVLATALTKDGKVPTASRWMVNSEGYTGKDLPEKPDIGIAETIPTDEQMIELIRDIFNGQLGVPALEAFEKQTQKIYEATLLILKYLHKSQKVPPKVREMLDIVTDRERLAREITGRFGPKSDNNINTLNRFYREGGLAQAQKYLTYRLVFEFIEGVNTNIILKNSEPNRITSRVIGGKWQNDNFDKVPDLGITAAIEQTLEDGQNQLLLYDHELGTNVKKKVTKLPANRRMSAEKYLWDTYDIWFKRHVNKRGAKDNYLEIAIECICPRRDTIFNPRVYHQY